MADGKRALLVVVIGQPDLLTCAAPIAPSANAVDQPMGLAVDAPGGRLFVADSTNNRVLVFDVATIQNNMAARFVLGQAFLDASTTVVASDGGLLQPKSLAVDSSNYRVLVFDLGP